jgi:hypothetical protein
MNMGGERERKRRRGERRMMRRELKKRRGENRSREEYSIG